MSLPSHSNHSNWYSTTYRKLHLDYHLPPWIQKPGEAITVQSARQQARMFKASGIQAVGVFVYDHYGQAFFPSKCGICHPHFQIDYPSLMLDALRKEKIKTIAYLNVLTSIHLAEKHPDWLIHVPDGSDPAGAWLRHPRSWLCLASPYAEEYYFPFIEEVFSRYPFDAVWLDALCWMVNTICHCPACLERFPKINGTPPPTRAPDSLEKCSLAERNTWFNWKTYRLGLVTEFHQKIVALLHRLRPGIVVMDNNAGQATRPFVELRDNKFYRWMPSSELQVDALSCDPVPFGGNHEMLLSFQARHQATLGKPFDYMNERFHTWGEWQMRAVTDWKLEFATILANGGCCFIADQPYPDGSLEPSVYKSLKKSYQFVQQLEPVCLRAKPVYDIGILAASPSQVFGLPMLGDEGSNFFRSYLRLAGAHLASVELGWQAHIFDEVALVRSLGQLRCVIIPDQELLDQVTIDALDSFVQQGGKLLLTGGSGRFDERFRERHAWPFEKMAGVGFEGEWPAPVNYFRADKKWLKLSTRLEDLPIQCWGRALRLSPKGAKSIAAISEPIPDVWLNGKRIRENFRHYTVTGACPPSHKTSGHAIFLNQYGKGTVMTLAVDPFTRYTVEGHRLLLGLVEASLEVLYPGKKRIVHSTDKPLHVEIHLTSQPHQSVLHAVNYFSQKRSGSMVTNEEVSPTKPFEVSVQLPFKASKITLEPGGKRMKGSFKGNCITVKIPSFEIHSAVAFHKGKK